jgi:hypothetical protein
VCFLTGGVAGSEREEFGGDPCVDAVQGAGVVAFTAEGGL